MYCHKPDCYAFALQDEACCKHPRAPQVVLRILLTGGTGYVGAHLLQSLFVASATQPLSAGVNAMEITYTHHSSAPLALPVFPRLKITPVCIALWDREAVFELVGRVNPHIVIHTAALCNTSACEKKPEMAFQVNETGTQHLAEAVALLPSAALFIHFSTDWVYDSAREKSMWEESDEQGATGFKHPYGLSKHAAEEAVKRVFKGSPNVQYVILRSALIYGPPSMTGKHCFLKFMLDGLKKNEPLKLFSDEYRTPIYIYDVFNVCLAFVRLFLGTVELPPTIRVWRETYNMGGSQRVSRLEMGDLLARLLGGADTEMVGVTLGSLGLEKSRPADLSMRNTKLMRTIGWVPVSFEEGLGATLKQTQGG